MELRKGFLLGLRHVLRLKGDAIISCGLPCTSFIWVNAGTHARSPERPLGNENYGYVKDGNVCRGLNLHHACNRTPTCHVLLKIPLTWQPKAVLEISTFIDDRDSPSHLLDDRAASLLAADPAPSLGLPGELDGLPRPTLLAAVLARHSDV